MKTGEEIKIAIAKNMLALNTAKEPLKSVLAGHLDALMWVMGDESDSATNIIAKESDWDVFNKRK